MDSALLKTIILDNQNRPTPGLIDRDLAIPSIPFTSTAIVGCRRCGKTFRMHQFVRDVRKQGIPENAICRIQFNDLRLNGFNASSLLLIDKTFYSMYPEYVNKQDVYFMFDEIQRIEGWEDYVLQLLDSQFHRVVLTGSTSKLLSGNIATQLRGKCLTSQMYGFSFKEYLRFNSIPVDTISSGGQAFLANAFAGYLKTGGFAGLYSIDEQQRTEGLQGYWLTMLLRDVVEAHPDRTINYELLSYVGQSIISRLGCPVTMGKIKEEARLAGYAFSEEVPGLMVRYLEEAFAVYAIPIFSQSVKIQNRNYHKVYACDWALANAVAPAGSLDDTRLFENLVFVELMRRGCKVYYFKTSQGYEIDFVAVSRSGDLSLYQVCYALNDVTKDRETRGIPETASFLGITNATIITVFDERECVIDDIHIRIVPAWKWLLEE